MFLAWFLNFRLNRFKNALSGLKFTRQNARKCSSEYYSKQIFRGCMPEPPSQTLVLNAYPAGTTHWINVEI